MLAVIKSFKLKIIFLSVVVLTFSSCGPFIAVKEYNYIERKGYNPQKDTLIVKPYEYYSKQKGYGAIFKENNCENKKDIKIDINEFAEKDTIPFDRIFKNMELILGDSTVVLNHAELYFIRKGTVYTIIYIDKQGLDTCSPNFSFAHIKEKYRTKSENDALLLWDVRVLKDGETYCIPNRVYYLK